MHKYIIMGPQGCGKGTQAKLLAKHLDLAHISVGDIFRWHIQSHTKLAARIRRLTAAGELVPDDIVEEIVKERMDLHDWNYGFILDGFPRTVEQAKSLDELLSELGRRVTAALLIDVPDEDVTRRISGRRTCVKSGHNYHVDFDPPKREGVCDQDGTRLMQRDDDKPDVVQNRLRVYHEQTEPLIDYYDQRGLMRRIDGTRSPADVHDHIRAMIATLRMEDDV